MAFTPTTQDPNGPGKDEHDNTYNSKSEYDQLMRQQQASATAGTNAAANNAQNLQKYDARVAKNQAKLEQQQKMGQDRAAAMGQGWSQGVTQGIIDKARSPKGPGIEANTLNEQAEAHEEEKKRHMEEAEYNFQQGKRNKYAKAQEVAATKAAGKFSQTMAQIGGAAGGAAAAIASMNTVTPDVQEQEQLGMQYNDKGNNNEAAGFAAGQTAIAERGAAASAAQTNADVNTHNTQSGELSRRGDPGGGEPPNDQPPKPTDTPPQPTDTPPQKRAMTKFNYTEGTKNPNLDNDLQAALTPLGFGPTTAKDLDLYSGAYSNDSQALALRKQFADTINNPDISEEEAKHKLQAIIDQFNREKGNYNNKGTVDNNTNANVSGTSQGERNFKSGGFTGKGNPNKVAGIVHKGEYVIPAKDVDQTTGKPKTYVSDVTKKNIIRAIYRRF